MAVSIPRPAHATPTENNLLRVLPAPAKVTIDGTTNGWDLSAGIFCCDEPISERDKMAVWLNGMYDQNNLYILARFIDDTPLNNPGQTIADYGWDGDCLQFRVITNFGLPNELVSHWTCWRGRDGHDLMDVAFGKNLHDGHIADAKTQGAQQAFTINPDGKGYIQELALPWKIISKGDGPPDAFNGLRATFEPNFTVGIHGRMSLKDLFQPNIRPDRVFTFRGWSQWGPAHLEAKPGPVVPQPVRLADGRTFPVTMKNGYPVVDWTGLIQTKELPGFVPVTFTMPRDGYISLNIKDSTGHVVRQLVNGEFYTAGPHTVKWDGLTTPNAGDPGQQVPAGNYTWNAIWNTGIGLKLRGFACNGGTVPWDDGPSTNWGGDEGPPRAVAAGDNQVYVGWLCAEAARGLLAMDQNGNVKWGNKRGGIGGVKSLAAGNGAVYVLGGTAGPDLEGAAIYKLAASDGHYLSWGDSLDADLHLTGLWPAGQAPADHADAIAVSGNNLYLSLTATGHIVTIAADSGKLINVFDVAAPGSLAASADHLYAITGGNGVTQFNLDGTNRQPLITGLTNPTAISVQGDKLFVGVGDPDNQIKEYDLTGKPLGSIGRPGGRQLLGAWQPDGLRFVNAIAATPDGKVWAAEMDSSPRRVSAWNIADGSLYKEYFGATDYGALGGAIDPLDPNVMVGQGCEWKLDPATGHASCVAIITREGMSNARFGMGNNGRLYLAVAPQWTHQLNDTSIFERVGEGQYKLRSEFFYTGADATHREATSTRFWADVNGDGIEQPEEDVTVPGNLRFSGWYMAFTPDMTLYVQDKFFKVTGFTPAGAPIYDVAHPGQLPGFQAGAGMGATSGLGTIGNTTMLYNGKYATDRSWFTAYDIDSGQLKWTYPNNYVGVHGSHNATPPEVGMIRGAYDICGTATLPAPIGKIWVIPTNVGEWHILTEDGFYLTRLFQGDPLKQHWPDSATPGAIMDNVPPGLGGEDFGGSIAQGTDGKLYIQAGKTGFWNLEVTGLDTVKALAPGSLTLGPADLVQSANFRETELQTVVGVRSYTIHQATPTFQGNIARDFKSAQLINYQKGDDSAVKTVATWDDQNLYLGYDVTDNTPWENNATAPEQMYISGDTVDFQLATDPNANDKRTLAAAGDLRLSIGNFQGTPTAVLYRKISDVKKPKIFSSGVVHQYPMDFVDTLPDAKIVVTKKEYGYVVEAAIPLADLNLKPSNGLTLKGDFGVTFSGEDGGRTRLRSYWNNQHTGIVDDAVFELQMEPQYWASIAFAP